MPGFNNVYMDDEYEQNARVFVLLIIFYTTCTRTVRTTAVYMLLFSSDSAEIHSLFWSLSDKKNNATSWILSCPLLTLSLL